MTELNMRDTTTLRIYVAGPYGASTSEQIKANISRANEGALEIAKKGHIPFVPHTMLSGWEDEFRVERPVVTGICQAWLEACDAFVYLGSSPGADGELELAKRLGLRIFHSLDEVPVAGSSGKAATASG